jgi:hypothetical protein
MPASAKVSNRLSKWKTREEEQAGREEAAGAPLRVWRALVNKLMKNLGRDSRCAPPEKAPVQADGGAVARVCLPDDLAAGGQPHRRISWFHRRSGLPKRRHWGKCRGS